MPLKLRRRVIIKNTLWSSGHKPKTFQFGARHLNPNSRSLENLTKVSTIISFKTKLSESSILTRLSPSFVTSRCYALNLMKKVAVGNIWIRGFTRKSIYHLACLSNPRGLYQTSSHPHFQGSAHYFSAWLDQMASETHHPMCLFPIPLRKVFRTTIPRPFLVPLETNNCPPL